MMCMTCCPTRRRGCSRDGDVDGDADAEGDSQAHGESRVDGGDGRDQVDN